MQLISTQIHKTWEAFFRGSLYSDDDRETLIIPWSLHAKYDGQYLMDVIAALRDEGVVVGEEVGPLQHAVQLQLGLVPGLRGDGDCKTIRGVNSPIRLDGKSSIR